LNFNIYNSIILAGIVQGLIFGAVVLLSKKYKHKSIFFLTSIIVIYSLSNLQFYLLDIGFISGDTLYGSVFIPYGNTVPALLYLYVTSYLYSEKRINRKAYFLFIPFLVSLFISLLYKIGYHYDFSEAFLNPLGYYLVVYDEFISAAFHIIIITILLKEIVKYSRDEKIFDDRHINLHLNWLKRTFIVMLGVAILWIVLTRLYMIYPDISFYPLWIAMAVLVYWLGHIGIYKYGIVEERKHIRKKKRYDKVLVSEPKTKHIIIERLKHFLEDEKRFLDASLTLEKTAKVLELSQGHLSKIINTELGISFKDYINTLRVDEAKTYLIDSDFSNYTLVAIGLEAGFNSKSAFNSSFKKITGETPSEFKKRHMN
jgi:AraC-like DNA-binding protein